MVAASGWLVDRRLFSVFGQCGVTLGSSWGVAPVPLPVMGLVVEMG
jgi:hypothetical protein